MNMVLKNQNCIDIIKNLYDNSIDAIIMCPYPYYDIVSFAARNNGKNFVGFELKEDYKKEAERILKTK